MKIEISDYNPGDDAELVQLASTIGVQALVKLGIDRSPCFSYLLEEKGLTWDLLVAKDGNRLAGFTEMITGNWQFRNETLQLTYSSLTGTAPDYRFSSVFLRLTNELIRRSAERSSTGIVGLINKRNHRLRKLLSKRYAQLEWFRPLVIVLIPVYAFLRFHKQLYEKSASENDYHNSIAEASGYCGDRTLQFDPSYYLRLKEYENADLLTFENDADAIVASLGLWNQNQYRRIRILDERMRYVLAIRTINTMVKAIYNKTFVGSDRTIHQTYSFLSFAKSGNENHFIRLVKRSLTHPMMGSNTILVLSLPETSSLLRYFHSPPCFKNIVYPFIYPLSKEMAEHCKHIETVFIDSAFI